MYTTEFVPQERQISTVCKISQNNQLLKLHIIYHTNLEKSKRSDILYLELEKYFIYKLKKNLLYKG